jgi:hypothetical protein
VKQAVTSWLHTLDTDFYAVIQAVMPRWDKCLNVIGNYMEIWCVPSAIQVSCRPIYRYESQIKFSGSQCLLTLFLKIFVRVSFCLLTNTFMGRWPTTKNQSVYPCKMIYCPVPQRDAHRLNDETVTKKWGRNLRSVCYKCSHRALFWFELGCRHRLIFCWSQFALD